MKFQVLSLIAFFFAVSCLDQSNKDAIFSIKYINWDQTPCNTFPSGTVITLLYEVRGPFDEEGEYDLGQINFVNANDTSVTITSDCKMIQGVINCTTTADASAGEYYAERTSDFPVQGKDGKYIFKAFQTENVKYVHPQYTECITEVYDFPWDYTTQGDQGKYQFEYAGPLPFPPHVTLGKLGEWEQEMNCTIVNERFLECTFDKATFPPWEFRYVGDLDHICGDHYTSYSVFPTQS